MVDVGAGSAPPTLIQEGCQIQGFVSRFIELTFLCLTAQQRVIMSVCG